MRKLFPILLLTARLVWAFRLCCLQWAELISVIHLQTGLDWSTYWQVLTGVLTDRFGLEYLLTGLDWSTYWQVWTGVLTDRFGLEYLLTGSDRSTYWQVLTGGLDRDRTYDNPYHRRHRRVDHQDLQHRDTDSMSYSLYIATVPYVLYVTVYLNIPYTTRVLSNRVRRCK